MGFHMAGHVSNNNQNVFYISIAYQWLKVVLGITEASTILTRAKFYLLNLHVTCYSFSVLSANL